MEVRIGAFEVYLCFSDELVLEASAVLPQWVRRGARGFGPPSRIRGLALASKLRSRAWPSPEAVLSRLLASLPLAPMSVSVTTARALPVPQVSIQASLSASGGSSAQEEEIQHWRVAGESDSSGSCQLLVPVCTPLCLSVRHPLLMRPQERAVLVSSTSAREAFVAERVVQLWQAAEGQELCVYASSPRAARGLTTGFPHAGKPPGVERFAGDLETSDGLCVRPDEFGCVRGENRDPLDDVELVACAGWHPGQLQLKAPENPALLQGGWREIARLRPPVVEVSLITSCCGTNLPGARVAVDNEDLGETVAPSCAPVTCRVRCGNHALSVRHVLAREPLTQALQIVDATTRGVEVELPLSGLHFVCVSCPTPPVGSDGQPRGPVADLLLVGGDLAAWRRGLNAPPADAKIWLWDGDLLGLSPGQRSGGARPPPLAVRDGRLVDAVVPLSAEAASGSHMGYAESRDDPHAGVECAFSYALSALASARGPWQVTFSRASGRGECAVSQLARAACRSSTAETSVWLGRLQPSISGSSGRGASGSRAGSRAGSRPTSPAHCGGGSGHASGSKEHLAGASASPKSLTPRPAGGPRGAAPPMLRMRVRMSCCCNGFEGVRVELGEASGSTDAKGDLELPFSSESPRSGGSSAPRAQRLSIDGIAPSLLPGGTSEYVASPPRRGEAAAGVDLDVACRLWFYWLPPEDPDEPLDDDDDAGTDRREDTEKEEEDDDDDDEDTYSDAFLSDGDYGRGDPASPARSSFGDARGDPTSPSRSSAQQSRRSLRSSRSRSHRSSRSSVASSASGRGDLDEPPEGTVWVCAAEHFVPEEAMPLQAEILCPAAEPARLRLDGTAIGPVLLRRRADAPGSPLRCILAQVELRVQPPSGFSYRPRDPSPLAERCDELGGCELQRLMACPCVLGYLPELAERRRSSLRS
eukprot:TRINITY_DN16710_c3_g2_i1.p1 TRINITY_DN16710_c3_g2~~TRINITY_DN16710_c3_g2_i1.p1  ORF type:complete len:1091 (+),score=255.34 TRINITY_DN16710_c3_g2_i1:489-3275(+)